MAPRFTPGFARTSRLFLTSYNVLPLWSSDVLFLCLCCSSNGATRRLPKEKEHVRDELRASEVGLTPLVVAIDELGAIVVWQVKRKQSWIALLTQIALKGVASRRYYFCSVTAVRWGVDTIQMR